MMMTYLKAAIITMFVFLCALIGFTFFSFDTEFELNVALESFLKGDIKKSQESLTRIKNGLPKGEYELYEAYLLREKHELKQATARLLQAEQYFQKHSQPKTFLEVLLNLFFNYYLLNNREGLESTANKLESLSLNDEYSNFFIALFYYEKGQYEQALKLWKNVTTAIPPSGWMKKSFEQVFTPDWKTIHIARCEIEVGDYLSARQTLVGKIAEHSVKNPSDYLLLIGLSYFREAQSKPLAAGTPYYKLAFSYLDQISLNATSYDKERQKIIGDLTHTISELIDNSLIQDLPFYTSQIEKLHAKESLDLIASRIVNLLDRQVASGNWNNFRGMVSLLNQILPESKAREALISRFSNQAKEALDNESISSVSYYLSAASILSKNPASIEQEIILKTVQKIKEIIPQDNKSLEKSIPFIEFLQDLQKDPQKRLDFAKELSSLACSLWLKEPDESKALALMKLATSFPYLAQQKLAIDDLESQIQKLYQEAEKRHQVDKLPSLFQAVKDLKIQGFQMDEKKQILIHLKKTESLLSSQKYQEALQHAEWVLTLDPKNEEVKRLLGLIYYNQSNFSKAAEYLSKLSFQDAQVKLASAVCEILCGGSKEDYSLLKALQDPLLIEQAEIQVGFGFLLLNDPEKALPYFKKLADKNPEALLGQYIANYQQNLFAEALDDFHRMSPIFAQMESIQGIAIISLAALQRFGEAEEMLRQLLQTKEQKFPQNASLAFANFYQQRLYVLNTFYIAGIYYKNYKKDLKTALFYLSKIINLTVEALYAKGEIYLLLNAFNEAIVNLIEALSKAKDSKLRRQIKPLLAKAYNALEMYDKSLELYREFFYEEPLNFTYRSDFGKALIKIRRYDLALTQYRELINHQMLVEDDRCDYIQSLVNTNQFEEAIEQASSWIDEKTSLSLLTKLKLSRLMIIANEETLVNSLIENFPSTEALTLQEKEELVRLYLDLGLYDKAEEVIKESQEEMEKTLSGLMLIANFHLGLSQIEKALSYARIAAKSYKEESAPQQFLDQYEVDTKWIEKRRKELKLALKKDDVSLADLLRFARLTNRLAFHQNSEGQPVLSSHLADLKETRVFLSRYSS